MKLNIKILNISAWFAILIAYIFPYINNGGTLALGYPFNFLFIITLVETSIDRSSSLNLLALLINTLILYFLITVFLKFTKKLKNNLN